jgi:inhibitor of KinA sporulation pathway (predicted exonuclease)
MLCRPSFIFGIPIICKTVKYIDQSENSSCQVLGCITQDLVWLTADWPVENVNPDMAPYGMSLDISESPEKKFKHFLLSRLIRTDELNIKKSYKNFGKQALYQ